MISIRALLLAVVMLGLAACASSAPVQELPPGDPLSDALGRAEYRLGPGDLLKVQVFQIPDLDRDIRIDNAGRISLPLIGAVDAAGLDIARLQERIAARYRERYLQDPQVTVSLQESPTQRVTVGGAEAEMQHGTLRHGDAEELGVLHRVAGEHRVGRLPARRLLDGEAHEVAVLPALGQQLGPVRAARDLLHPLDEAVAADGVAIGALTRQHALERSELIRTR